MKGGALANYHLKITENYGIWWSYIPHFLEAPGYVYAYAFGELLVLSLYRKFMEQDFEIRSDDPDFWREGLNIMDEMLNQAEELVNY